MSFPRNSVTWTRVIKQSFRSNSMVTDSGFEVLCGAFDHQFGFLSCYNIRLG